MRKYENKNLRGWDRFIYNLYMILTFPVRKWWVILSILATVLLILIIIPTLEGIKKEDIIDWYKAKWTHSEVNRTKNETIAKISKKMKNLKDDAKSALSSSSSTSKKDNKKESELVSWNVAEFKKAKYIPNASNKVSASKKVHDSNTYALIKEHVKQSSDLKGAKQHENSGSDEKEDVYYEVRTDLNLEYLDKPETISGVATISGANELYIDDTFVYLYGIYTSPRKYNISEVKNFLESITQDQIVECDVVAYSTQTSAKTALCFVNGVLLNKQMVSENLADNIALKME